MRKLLFVLLSIAAFPVMAELCTPNNPVFTLNPGKIAVINGVKTCVSGSCMTSARGEPVAIVPLAKINLGASGTLPIDFATIQTSSGTLTLQYVPGPFGSNPNGAGGTGVCETNPIWFFVKMNNLSYEPQFASPDSVKRVQFHGNTFRSTLRVYFVTMGAYLNINDDYLTFSLEGIYTPTIPGPHIDVIAPTYIPSMVEVWGSGFTANDVVLVNGTPASVKMFSSPNMWFVDVGSVRPTHVRISNSTGTASGSTIPEIAPVMSAEY